MMTAIVVETLASRRIDFGLKVFRLTRDAGSGSAPRAGVNGFDQCIMWS